MVDVFRMIQYAVGMLSGPDRGASVTYLAVTDSRVYLWRIWVVSSRYKLVMILSGLLSKIIVVVIFVVQDLCHKILILVLSRSIHMPLGPITEASQNPRWVRSCCKILSKWLD